MFLKRKRTVKTYDKENLVPVIRCSICTGEKVAGFKDLRTGAFQEISLINTQKDLADFMSCYGVEKITEEY